MATLTQQFKRPAGKTIKPPGPVELSPNSSDAEEEEEPEDQDGSEAGKDEVTPPARLDLFEAPDPVRDEPETLDPSEVTVTMVNKFMQPKMLKVHVGRLRWDMKQQWGQIRGLDSTLVQYYLQQLRQEPPRQPIRLLVRDSGSGMKLKVTPNRSKFFSLHRL